MRSFAALLSLACLALPATAGAAPSSAVVMDTRRVVLELLLISDGLQDPFLVGVRGASGSGLRQRVAQVRPDAALRFEALPADGALGEQLALAMGKVDARCALSLEPAGAGAWSVAFWGACARPPGVAVGTSGSAGARVGQALQDDPHDADLLLQHMALAAIDGPGHDSQAPWHIVEGSGFELSTQRFALQVGDTATVRQLERERRWGTGSTVLLASAGGAAALTGLGVLGRGFTLASSAPSYEQQVTAEQRAWTGVVITAAGAMVLSGVPRLRRSLLQRRSRPDQLYTREQAQAWLEAYNGDLERELGVVAPAPLDPPSPGASSEDSP